MVTKLMAIDPFYEEKFTRKNRDQIAYIINRKTDKIFHCFSLVRSKISTTTYFR